MIGKQGLPLHDVLKTPQVASFILKEEEAIPNSALPVLVYFGGVTLPEHDAAALLEELFQANDWGGTWRDGIYTYHHYHSTTHEVLGVYRGAATVLFGGEHGMKQKLSAGDVVILPAGVAHKNLGASSDFGVVAGYPGGAEWDMNYGRPEERAVADVNLARVPIPRLDPVYGAEGPLLHHWVRK